MKGQMNKTWKQFMNSNNYYNLVIPAVATEKISKNNLFEQGVGNKLEVTPKTT